MIRLYYTWLLGLLVLAACSTSEYGSERSSVELTMRVSATQCYNGQPFIVELGVLGPETAYDLSVLLTSGAASVNMQGAAVSSIGEWIRLTGTTVQLTITPQQEGELVMSFRVRTGSGDAVSRTLPLRRMVLPGAAVTTEVTYDAEVVNPSLESLVPLRLTITKPGYQGDYTVTVEQQKGKGAVYYNGYMVSGTAFRVGGEAALEYHPRTLGDHLLEFTVSAAGESAAARVYLDVYNSLKARCEAPCGVQIKGVGDYDKEGQEAVLELVNDEGFNFEAAGWYDAQGTLVSAEPQFRQKMSVGALTEVVLKLRQRDVVIVKNGERDEENRYVEIVNGVPTVKYCYRVMTSLSADHRLSDTLVFYYQRAQYNMSTVPPAPQWQYVTVDFNPCENWLGYFYRIGGEFRIYLRKADNPSFTFTGRYAVKGVTRYYISEPIIIQ